jgi:hypothetical protein
MSMFRVWLAHRMLAVSSAFLRAANYIAPKPHIDTEPYDAFAADCEEHGEAYETPLHMMRFRREKGGVVSLRPMDCDTDGSE